MYLFLHQTSNTIGIWVYILVSLPRMPYNETASSYLVYIELFSTNLKFTKFW